MNDFKLKNNDIYSSEKLQQNIETKKPYHLILIYSIPIVFSTFINVIFLFLNRYWLGRLSKDIYIYIIASIGISMIIINTITASAQLIGVGTGSNISIKLGEGKQKEAQDILNNGIILSFVVSIIILISSSIFLKPLLYLIGASENTINYILEYSKIVIYGSPFYILSFTLSSCISATGKTKIFAITQIISIIISIILDPIFILILDLKLKGAAFSILISQIVWFICILYYYLSRKSIFKLNKLNFKLDLKICKNIIKIGISPFFLTISNTFVMILLNNQLKYYGNLELGSGEMAIGAMSIITVIILFFLIPIMSINQGIQPLIGFSYGKKDIKKVKSIYIYSCIYCIIISFVCFITTTFFSENIAKIFTKNEEVIKLTAKGMKIFLSAFIFNALEINSINLFQAIGKSKTAIYLIIFKQALLIVPSYIKLPQIFGLLGIWISGPVVDITAIFITLIFVIREFKSLKESYNN